MWRARDEIMPGLRSVLVHPYVIFYRLTETNVEIASSTAGGILPQSFPRASASDPGGRAVKPRRDGQFPDCAPLRGAPSGLQINSLVKQQRFAVPAGRSTLARAGFANFLLPSTRGGRAPRGARCLRSHRYVPCDRHVKDACEASRIPLRSGMQRPSALMPRLFADPGLPAPVRRPAPAGNTVGRPGRGYKPRAGNRSRLRQPVCLRKTPCGEPG